MSTQDEIKNAIINSLPNYEASIEYLHNVGLIEHMRQAAMPKEIPMDSPNYREAHLVESGRVKGYTEALNDLIQFVEDRKSLGKKSATLTPTYGAVEKLIASGKATKEQINEFRRKQSAEGNGAASN